MEPAWRKQAAAMVDAIAANGSCEFMGGIAGLFASRVIVLMAGFPIADSERLLDIVGGIHNDYSAGSNSSRKQLVEYISDTIASEAKRRRRRGVLAHMLANEDTLSDVELRGFFALLFITGIHGGGSSIGFAFLALARNPQLRSRLCDNPTLIPAFVDEVLRVETSSPWIPRRTTKQVTLGGITLPVGTLVQIHLGAINTEDNPNIDVDANGRARKRHWAFGVGPHRCLASHVARTEMTVLVGEWLKRIPDFALAPGYTPAVVYERVGDELSSLPLTWNTQ